MKFNWINKSDNGRIPGQSLFIGAGYMVGHTFRRRPDYSTDPYKWGAANNLPGASPAIMRFTTEDEARTGLEESVQQWIEKAQS